MATQGIDDLGALANQQITGSEDHGGRLLGFALDGDEAHGRALSGLADGLRISHVILLALDEGLDVGGWDEAHLMAQISDGAGPVMRAGAGFHCDAAAGLICDEGQHLLTSELLAEQDCPCGARPVSLEDVLRDVQTDRANLFHGCLLAVVLNTTTLAH
jgi:hypothetical protein